MTLKMQWISAIMLALLFFLIGCATSEPWNPVMGEDIIPTDPGQTIETPGVNGAWYSDRYIEQIFADCLR